ncbi:hypothetical protein [Nocardiopsis trehalosi]|jgi:hypothetical protein|uniref:hypothetical protein n=1 Tax=Nocardiopsis trehalosi TaxID=109329 RepID=UPI00083440E8|nr:hypothetical protein [Nocardiopsis trehalosi]
MAATRFDFAFDPRYTRPLGLIGVRPGRAYVDVGAVAVLIRFGPWRIRVPRTNIAAAHIGGPYSAWKVVGPHLSLADGGLTLGTRTGRGVCLELHRPMRGIEPIGLVRHRGITVTVGDPEGLAAAVTA